MPKNSLAVLAKAVSIATTRSMELEKTIEFRDEVDQAIVIQTHTVNIMTTINTTAVTTIRSVTFTANNQRGLFW